MGCDAEQFINFLQSKKGELGLYLNNWALNELTLAFKEFSSLYNYINISNNQNFNQEQQNIDEENNENKSKLIQMDVETNPNQKFQSQEEYIFVKNLSQMNYHNQKKWILNCHSPKK